MKNLSGYEDKDEASVVVSPATKKKAAPRRAAKARKKPQTLPQNTPPSDNSLAKAIVIHGVFCQRPMADIIEDEVVRRVMGAHWLLGDNRRFGKATSSILCSLTGS